MFSIVFKHGLIPGLIFRNIMHVALNETMSENAGLQIISNSWNGLNVVL